MCVELLAKILKMAVLQDYKDYTGKLGDQYLEAELLYDSLSPSLSASFIM